MSNESLALPYNSTVGLVSLEPGLLPGDTIRWDGTQWQIVQNDRVGAPVQLPGAPPAFNPAGAPPDVNAGYLYKKNGLPGLYWYPDGGPEINLVGGGGGGIPVIGSSTNQAIVRWSGITGDALLNSGVTLSNLNEFFQGPKRIMVFDTATENTSVGADAIITASGGRNTVVGYEAGFGQTTATDNTFVGHGAGHNVITQGSTTGIGASALENNQGAENVAVGYHAMQSNTTGFSSVGIGYNALAANITGSNNTALGNRALQSLVVNAMNTAIGSNTLTNNTAANNTAVGGNSLSANTTGTHNAALGDRSLELNTIGNENTSIGSYSLANNSTGSNNTAVGYRALVDNTTDNNTAVGFQSMESNTTGTGNTAVGMQALMGNNGDQNTALGYNAGFSNTTGTNNVFVGWNSGQSITTGGNNVLLGANTDVDAAGRVGAVVIGDSAVSASFDNSLTINKIRGPVATANGLFYDTVTGEVTYATAGGSTFADSAFRVQDNGDNTKQLAFEVSGVTTGTTRTITVPNADGVLPANFASASNLVIGPVTSGLSGSSTTIVGSSAGAAIGAANNTTLVGYQAGGSITTGSNIVAVGSTAGSGITNAARSTAVGSAALITSNSTDSVAVGHNAMNAHDANQCVAVGSGALAGAGIAPDSVAIGFHAMGDAALTGLSNTAVGHNSMRVLTSGNSNTAVGNSALLANATGSSHIAIGHNALAAMTAGTSNIGVGVDAGAAMVAGVDNVMIGDGAMIASASCNQNVAIGADAMANIQGDQNVAIGKSAMGTLNAGSTPSNNVVIGANSGTAITTGASGNVVVGRTAGNSLQTGIDNVLLGNTADVDSIARSGVIVIGANTTSVSASNSFTVRSASVRNQTGPNFLYFDNTTGEISRSAVSGLVHGGLAGLTANDHPQYLLRDGTNAMTGTLDLGTQDIKSTDTLNIAIGGVNRLGVSTTSVTSTLPFVAPAGTYGSPGFQFGASSGIYKYDTNTIEISQGLAGDGGGAYLARFSPLGGWSQIRTSNAGLTKPNVFIDQQYYGGNLTAGSGMLSLGDAYTSTGTAWNHILCWNNSGNSFRVQGNGAVYADNAYSSSGADYAEYFESLDGKSIPIGSTVVLVDGKLRQADITDLTADIIGVIRPKNSTDVAAVSNVFEDYWSGKYEKDEFGAPVEEEFTAYSWSEDGKMVSYHADRIPAGVVVPETKNTVTSTRLKWAAGYNPTSVYVPRSQRTEWHIVGILGQIPIKNGEIINPRWIRMGNIGDGSVAKKYLVR